MPSNRTVAGLGVDEGRLTALGTATTAIRGEVARTGRDLVFTGAGAVDFGGAGRGLEEFTVEATASPDRLGERQNVLESQDPPVALYVESDGTVTGSVHTAEGWKTVSSGDVALSPGDRNLLRLSRDRNGVLRLEVDRQEVAAERLAGPLESVGEKGFTVGAGPDGSSWNFSGRIADVRVRDTAVTAADIRRVDRRARELASRLSEHLDVSVSVESDPGSIDHRLDHVKSIMQAAGVDDAAELATLTVDEPTTLRRGTVMVAPRRSPTPSIDWGEFVDRVATLPKDQLATELATNVFNRNSLSVLRNEESEETPLFTPGSIARLSDTVELTSARAETEEPRPLLGRRSALPGVTRGSRLERRQPTRVPEVTRPEVAERPGIAPEVFEALESTEPAKWPGTAEASYAIMSLETLPVDSAVIIAGTLDLRNTRLRIEPEVSTLYVIAETVICGDSAEITWRQPGGYTPPRNRDPSKDGRSWSGVHTDSSGNGLPGGDGRPGDPGVNGANGRDAPSIELWVKELTDMPNIDLKGEQGITGGQGQPGGRGGSGAKGEAGEWYWAFGKRCWDQPGHGGDGGDGADGGRGGRGGNGGHGGDITIGVLEGTLEETVTSRSFKLNNDGGDPGRGGPGGSRGEGGRGGPHGNSYVGDDEVCTEGRPGADGQPGERGQDGYDGYRQEAGDVTFMEFTEESWNEQLTKPWLTDVSPDAAFPGGTLLLSGPRFADTDEVVVGGVTLNPTLLSDGRLEVTVPEDVGGSRKDVFVRRHDGAESNELQVWVRPRLDSYPSELTPGVVATLRGRGFLSGASVLFDDEAVPADVTDDRTLSFEVPETGGTGAAERSVTLAVRNPDGYLSDEQTAQLPRVLKNGFEIGVHDFSFDNFKSGSPSWDTFEETFGALEVWHEQLDPIFGHPILTPLFYAFYHEFLKGEDRGGLATGFCTSLASVALDEFWTGSDDTHSRYTLDAETRRHLTAIHGRLLSKESLTRMHDQSRQGIDRVEQSFRVVENAFQHGSRENAPLLFFIPSGAIWDAGYMEGLEESHCVVPTRIQYPIGHDGTDPDGVALYVWDNNHPIGEGEATARNCRVEFFRQDGEIHFEYYDGDRTTNPKFSSQDGLTLGTQTLDEYLLSDVDMPFSGPFGLTRFIVDFLLSPADLKVTDGTGRVTGVDDGQIKAEIPDSHPVYLRRGAFLLPVDTALTRTVTGRDTGTYDYHSLSPRDTSVSLENVDTSPGEADVLRVNADGTQVRFEPGTQKTLDMTLGRRMSEQIRGLSVSGVAGGPDAEVDVTLSDDLSVVRVGNRGPETTVDVRLVGLDPESTASATVDRRGVALPTDNDLAVLVTDWENLSMEVRTVPFEA